MKQKEDTGKKFERLVEIMDTLRGERGCPWDKKQDETTIVNYLLEEVYEAAEAVTQGNSKAVAEELGDVMMELVFLARIYKEKGAFSLSDVIEGINLKMIRRHPHVFGDSKMSSADSVVHAWAEQKKKEKNRESILDGWVKSAPALLTAFELGKRVSAQGFDWPDIKGVFTKVREEIDELEQAMETGNEEEAFQEIGDLFFALANVSRHLGVNPELAVRRANDRFDQRFRYLEGKLKEKGKRLDHSTLEEMEELWEEAKREI